MTSGHIFVTKAVCGNCTPAEVKEEDAPKKWGMGVTMGGFTAFMCDDCLKTILDKIGDAKKNEQRVISASKA